MEILHVRNGTLELEGAELPAEIPIPPACYWQIRTCYTELVLLQERLQALQANIRLKEIECNSVMASLGQFTPDGNSCAAYELDFDCHVLRLRQ